MPATITDLPPELISRVLELLSGAWPTTFEWGEMYIPGSLVALDKRETGNCALVCRYWATIIRRSSFENLRLRTEDDADALLSFVTFPHAPELSIAPHILIITLVQKITDSPWAQRIFVHKKAFPNINILKLELQGDCASGSAEKHLKPTRPIRSVFPQLPEALPPSTLTFPTGGSCEIKDIVFRNYGDLNAFLRSARQLDYRSWPNDSREPTSPQNWEFERCAISDTISPTSVRPVLFRGPGASLKLVGCPRPWTFLRAVLSRTRTTLRFNCETLIWGPMVLAGAHDVMEKIIEELVSCCPVYSPAGDGAADTTHTHEGSLRVHLDAIGGRVDGEFAIEFQRWCFWSGIYEIQLLISPSGSIETVSAVVHDPDLVVSLPWTKIDDILADLGPSAPTFVLKRTSSFFEYQQKPPFVTLIEPIQMKMPRLLCLGKLQFFDYNEKDSKYFAVIIEDVHRREKNPEEQGPTSTSEPSKS